MYFKGKHSKLLHMRGATKVSTVLLIVLFFINKSFAFQTDILVSKDSAQSWFIPSKTRRIVALSSFGSMFGGFFQGADSFGANASMSQSSDFSRKPFVNQGATNEIISVVDGIKRRRLGGSDIIVSEIGLGTQRWVSTDFNAPDEKDCFQFMDEAVLNSGVNLIDTAEQYPIPSGGSRFRNAREGDTELVIGKWMKDRKVSRDRLVIATKITGGRNVNAQNIMKDCAGSLKRLGTDYIDVYQLHWPQRYSPQSNWGQSLQYHLETERDPYWRMSGGPMSFGDLCLSMEKLIQEGKIRGWGLCNDNAYGLTACTRTAMMLGTTPPCSIQGDFSLIDRKSEENGVAEAASPYNENVGFMAYNVLAGGMLTGKYLDIPASNDDLILGNRERASQTVSNPRGRMDTRGWGGTLYRYRSEAAQTAIGEYNAIARRLGITLTELSLRWCKERSLLTTSLIGHSNINQLRETLNIFRNAEPIPDEVMWEIDLVHLKNRLPIFTSSRAEKDWWGQGEIGERIP